jgi:hypothetical protein
MTNIKTGLNKAQNRTGKRLISSVFQRTEELQGKYNHFTQKEE